MDGSLTEMEKYDYEHWYIGGHSLGGAMAADYAAGHSSAFDGLVLLASYSAKDLSDASFPVLSLSIYGSEDGVLNMDKIMSFYARISPHSLPVTKSLQRSLCATCNG